MFVKNVIVKVCIFVLLTPCLQSFADDAQDQSQTAKPKPLEACQLGGIAKIHRVEKVFLAAQPSAEDFRLAKEREGIKTVINLRMADELSWDQAGTLKQLGIEYVHIPFRTPDSLTDEVFDKARKVLNNSKRQPILMHCAVANRVGAVWLVHRVLDEKVSYEQALDEAKKVGLKSVDYETRAKAYISRQNAKK